MITPSFSLTATERVLPKLALDFTTASLDPRVTLTRALNTATCVNSSGYVATVNANLPRFDYSTTSIGTCKGLLIEESRINICQYSEDPAQSPWDLGYNVSAPGGTTTSPSNGTAKFIAETAATGVHILIQAITIAASTAYTFSIFLKANGRTKGKFGPSSLGYFSTFDLSLGQITGNTAGVTASSITAYPNSWYRLTLTYTSGGAGASSHAVYFMDDAGSTSYTGDTSKGYYVWGAQLEAGAFPTSYIPNLTTGTTTRNADEASMSGTNFTDWWNSTANTIEFQYQTTLSGSATGNRYIGCVAKDATNYIEICGKSTAAKTIVYQSISGSFDVALTGATSIFTSTYNKLIVAMQANNYGFALNSTAQGTDTNCTLLSSPTSFEIGRWKEGASYGGYFCGWVQKINAYPQRLTASELSAFTAG